MMELGAKSGPNGFPADSHSRPTEDPFNNATSSHYPSSTRSSSWRVIKTSRRRSFHIVLAVLIQNFINYFPITSVDVNHAFDKILCSAAAATFEAGPERMPDEEHDIGVSWQTSLLDNKSCFATYNFHGFPDVSVWN
jgi:hypothetical protein